MAAKDMTIGSPAKLIFFFTMPLIAGNLVSQLYGFVDTLLVGRYLGVQSLAAVGCAMPMMFLCMSLVGGLTAGLTIYTGQQFGAKRYDRVRRSVACCIVAVVGMSLAMGIFGVFAGRSILEFMGTPAELIDGALIFTRIILGTVPIAMSFILLTQFLRALGDSKTPTILMSASLGSNILLEILFLVEFGWGIPGAAMSTVVAQLLGLIVATIYIWKKMPLLHTHLKDWIPSWAFMYVHLRIALPMGFQASLIALGIFCVQIALNRLGPDAVASFAAASRVDSLAMMPMMSFGMAMAAYTAQNFGAKNFDRIREGVNKCIMMSALFALLVGLFNGLCGSWLMEIFVGAEATQVIDYGHTYLIINGCTYWILSLLFVYRFTLQGVGQSFVPTVAGVMELIMRGGAAFVLADMWGYAGVCLANPLAWLGSCVPLAIAYYATVYRRKNA